MRNTVAARVANLISALSALCVLCAICGICALSGCASDAASRTQGKIAPVYITNRAVFPFLAPREIDEPLDMLQRIEGSFGEKEFAFLIYVKANDDGTELRVLNDFGSEIARIAYSPDGVESSGLATKAGLKVEYILADFQIGYYAATALTRDLSGIGLTFTESTEGDAVIREVRDGTELVMRIEKRASGLELRNYLRGYRYTVTYEE